MVRLYVWNFPSFVRPEQREEIRGRLTPESIRRTFRKASTEMVTPFSALGTNYFLADPLGLMETLARGGNGFSQFTSFDFNWGSGNRFFSKDHPVVADDYATARVRRGLSVRGGSHGAGCGGGFPAPHRRGGVSRRGAACDSGRGLRLRRAGQAIHPEEHPTDFRNFDCRQPAAVPAGLPRIPLFLLSLLPASLGILWTTGVASYYPGEVNLISMSFIAILAGLGDDQVVHFFNRVPQEWVKTGSLDAALMRTYETIGKSILFCILTAATATVALALSSFKVLAEFGFILTAGMFMMMFHTLLTVPALMRLWWRFSKPRAPETITFRFLPFVARHTVNFVGRHARLVAGVSIGAFVLSLAALPMVRMSGKIEISRGEDNPAIAGQRRLSASFGIEGSPEVLLYRRQPGGGPAAK